MRSQTKPEPHLRRRKNHNIKLWQVQHANDNLQRTHKNNSRTKHAQNANDKPYHIRRRNSLYRTITRP